MSNWISVKERLPERPGVYLVYRRDAPDRGVFVNPQGRVTSRVYYGDGKWGSRANITDWMPQPEPPQSEEEK